MGNLQYRFKGYDIGLPMIFSGGFHNFLHTVDLHSHLHPEGVEITYVMKGDACWLLDDGTELFLSGGSLAVIQPNVLHQGRGNIISPCWLFWFVLDLEAADVLLNTPFSTKDAGALNEIFRNAGNCVRRVPDDYKFHAKRLLDILGRSLSAQKPQSAVQSVSLPRDAKRLPRAQDETRDLIRLGFKNAREDFRPTNLGHLSNEHSQDFLQHASLRNSLCTLIIDAAELLQRSAGITRPGSQIAGKAENIMRINIERNLSMGDIAEMLCLSTTGLIKRFKQETGLTPADFYQRIKIEEARRRLTGTDASITETAFNLGFSTSQYFASVFKKYTGTTPREYRRSCSR